MTDPIPDNLSSQFGHMKLKEPNTPPYSMMLKNSSVHARSNSYCANPNIFDAKTSRPRAYSSGVFDFDYVPPAKTSMPPQNVTRQPITPKQRIALFVPGHVTPPELSPYSQSSSDVYSPLTPTQSQAQAQAQTKSQAQHVSMTQTPMNTSIGSTQPFGAPLGLAPTSSAGTNTLGTPAQIYALCKDQKGCRVLQHKLQEGNPAVFQVIFEATLPHMTSLMVDPFGNYFCQKLIEFCSPSQITKILHTIQPKMVDIAIGQHGTRALQRIIESIETQEQVSLLISALDGSVVRIIRDINGNHVIQKCLVELDQEGSQFIYDSVYCNVISVGTHRHGCCVLQRCLDNALSKNKRMLVSQIVAKSLDLVRDPFGNYVCQYVVDLKVHDYTFGIVSQLLGHLAELSTQKFSSNVVEKCLWTAEPEQKSQMTQELISACALQKLLLDPYGNYVIQTTLESSSGAERTMVVEAIHQCLSHTRTPYGRRIMLKLKALT